MDTLDLKTFPLDGMSLIEASAGTGKTYAVSNLILRYVLEKEYAIENILVVTFTEAATQELRVRIRAKLNELCRAIEHVMSVCQDAHSLDGAELKTEITAATPDPLLQHLLQQQTDLAQALVRLKLAERSIDLAEVHTIHGFCQKVLQEHAVQLGLPAQQELKEDLTGITLQICEDIWRREILKLPSACLEYVLDNFSSPEQIYQATRTFGSRQPERVTPRANLHKRLEGQTPIQWWAEQFAEQQKWLGALSGLVESHIDEVTQLIAPSAVLRVKDKLKWLSQIKLWQQNGAKLEQLGELKFERFFESKLSTDVKKDKAAPSHVFFSTLERHFEQRPAGLYALFVQAVIAQVEALLNEKKAAEQVLGFDDLIGQVYEGVNDPKLVPALVPRLRQQYKVALIDEFQDTDAKQYGIFSRLFGLSDEPSSQTLPASLVLIGDPKQAIYGFRGGDMATYLSAKRDVSKVEQGGLYTMRQNWRSSPQMLSALNHLYLAHSNPFLELDIPYIEVSAGKLQNDTRQTSALVINQIEARKIKEESGKLVQRNKAELLEQLSTLCALQIKYELQMKKRIWRNGLIFLSLKLHV